MTTVKLTDEWPFAGPLLGYLARTPIVTSHPLWRFDAKEGQGGLELG